jgi:hypothetical protein
MTVSRQGDQWADAFVEHTVRRSAALPWLMDSNQRSRLMPSGRRLAAATLLLVVLVGVVLWAAISHFGPSAKAPSAATLSACALVERDQPGPAVAGSPVRFDPSMLSAVAHSGNPALEREWRPMVVQHGGAAAAGALAAYHQLVAVCQGLPRPG